MVPELLRGIRDEVVKTNERLDATRTELSATRAELSGRLDRLERRQTESEIRLATAITAMAGTLIEVRDLLKDRAEDRDRMTQFEHRLEVVERRAG